MSILVDDIVIAPKEAVPGGVEASLSEAGLTIVGASLGEVVRKGTEVKTAGGVVMVDREPQTRNVVLKLEVRQDSETTLPQAAARLEQIVGELQARDGWFRRDFHVGGNFASLLYHVCGEVTLGDFAGWQAGDCPDVTLSMVCDYAAYVTEEEASGVFSTNEGERELTVEIQAGGSVNGLLRMVVTNEGEEDLRGLIVAGECIDHPQDASAETTAALAYDCAALTPKGGSEEAKREGLNILRNTELTAGWLTILGSEIGGVGHMTHKGVRKPEFRAYDSGNEAGDVQFKFRYRSLGTLQWTDTEVVKSVLVDGWQTITWNQVPRLGAPTSGDPHWDWELRARAVSGSGAVDLHRVRITPTEIYVRCTAPPVQLAPDLQQAGVPATFASVKAPIAGVEEEPEWNELGKGSTSDNSYAYVATKNKGSVLSQRYVFTNPGFKIPEDATIVGAVVALERSKTGNGNVYDYGDQGGPVRLVKEGAPVGEGRGGAGYSWPSADTVEFFGASDDSFGVDISPLEANSEGFGFSLRVGMFSNDGTEVRARVDAASIILYYTEASDPNRLCFAKRSAEIASDGVSRQHPEEDIWGLVVPEGFLPVVSPSGAEGRTTRFMVVPSQGDFGELPDKGDSPISTQVFVRPGVLYAAEAA